MRGWLDSLLNATAGKLEGGGEAGDEPERVDPELAQARAHLDAGDFDAARSAYQKILDIWEDEAPGAVLYRPVEIYGIRRDINWKPVPPAIAAMTSSKATTRSNGIRKDVVGVCSR